jgi:hypothetical protein
MDVEEEREIKRKRESNPTANDFYRIGQEIQNRIGRKISASISEDRRFREFFGAGVRVVMATWNLLVETELLPEDGQIVHLLWTLYFFKVYPKQGVACSAAGGSSGAIDPKTWRKYIWPFVFAIADLEQIVVSFDS